MWLLWHRLRQWLRYRGLKKNTHQPVCDLWVGQSFSQSPEAAAGNRVMEGSSPGQLAKMINVRAIKNLGFSINRTTSKVVRRTRPETYLFRESLVHVVLNDTQQ
jgi:hypothetical protein